MSNTETKLKQGTENMQDIKENFHERKSYFSSYILLILIYEAWFFCIFMNSMSFSSFKRTLFLNYKLTCMILIKHYMYFLFKDV